MSPTVRLRSRRQTTGPQSSTRLLKRPGERPRVAKPQPSEQGLPPRRKPGAKLRSRRSARQQRRRGSKPSSERSVKLPRRRSATLREKPSARRRGRQSVKPLRKRRSRLPNARNARRRRRRSVKPPARSSAKRPRRQSEKLPGSRRWRLPHRQSAKLQRRSRPSARRLNEQNARRRTGNPGGRGTSQKRSCRETRVRHIRRDVVYRWHPTEMNAPAEAFRCQALAKEIAAELRAKLAWGGAQIDHFWKSRLCTHEIVNR